MFTVSQFKQYERLIYFLQETLYTHQRLCRKFSALVAILVLAVCAYRYCDLATVNNQLLVEIRKQNSDLKKLMLGKISKKSQDQ